MTVTAAALPGVDLGGDEPHQSVVAAEAAVGQSSVGDGLVHPGLADLDGLCGDEVGIARVSAAARSRGKQYPHISPVWIPNGPARLAGAVR